MFNENININVDLNTLKFPNDVFRVPKIDDKWDSCPIPFDDESFLSWLTRLAKENYSDVDLIYSKFRQNGNRINNSVIHKELDEIQLNKGNLITFYNNLKEFIDLNQKSENKIIYNSFKIPNRLTRWDYFLIPNSFTNYCPYCLKNDEIPYFRNHWYLKFYLVCHVHNILLKNKCPHCFTPVKFWNTKWNKSILQCTNCDKSILDELKIVSRLEIGLNTKFQTDYLLIYQEKGFKGNSVDPIDFYRQLFKLLLFETKDTEIKEILNKESNLDNERLLNGLLNVYRVITNDYNRLKRPYICEIDGQKFCSAEELKFHENEVHALESVLKSISDKVAKRKFEIIAPLLNLKGRTANDVKKRALICGTTLASIYRYIRQYEKNGVKGLNDNKKNRGNKSLRIPKEIERIIYKHIRKECGCCSSVSSNVSIIRNVREECKMKGLRPPATGTIRKRMSMVK